MKKRALVFGIVMALTLASVASATSQNDTKYGITQYQSLFYNTQSCGDGHLYVQLTQWSYRWYRTDTTRTASFRGLAGFEGFGCGRTYTRGSIGSTTWNYVCWGCADSTSPLWSRQYIYNISQPYAVWDVGGTYATGSWLEAKMMTTGGVQKDYLCQQIPASSTLIGCGIPY